MFLHAVLWTNLVFISAELSQLGCNSTEVCYGFRPKYTSGCCPVRAGSACGAELECDIELGYNCSDGFCAGKQNLTVVRVGKTDLNLTWTPFLPNGSNRTYSVLYGTGFPADSADMNSHNVGNMSRFTLEGLTPGTWYYIQVAVSTNNGYQNLTEIALAETEAMDHCTYNGRRISVGEDLVIDCEESCHCTSSGRFECVPVCQKQSEGRVCSDRNSRDQCCVHVNHCYNDSCTYLGEPVEHQFSWIIDCAENCTCHDGSVTCVALCDDVTTDVNCTNYIVTKIRDGCCESKQCYEEDTCVYKNASYKTDTWFRAECEICTCSSLTREVTCVDLKKCGSTVLPELSTVCPHATIEDSHCCSQINCEKQTGPNDILGSFVISEFTTSSIIVQFHFISSKDIQEALRMTLLYTTDTSVSGSNFTSWSSNMTYFFKDVIDATNETFEFRDFGKPFVLYKINSDFLFVLPNLKMNKYYFVKLIIDFDKTRRVVQEYATTTKAIRIQAAPYPLMSTINKVHINVVNISSTSAFLSWVVPDRFLHNITSFLIKYKSLSDKNWHYTKRLIFSERQSELVCLYSLRWYEVHLEAYPGAIRLATTFFNTTAAKELSDEMFSTNFANISLRTTSVFVSWQLKTASAVDKLNNIEVFWTRAKADDIVYKDCVSGDRKSYNILDLNSGTMYTVWLGLNLLSGETVYSNRLHLVTVHVAKSEHSSTNHSIVVAVTVACVSGFAMFAAIATVIYLLKCKRRATYQDHTSFENRIFQIYSSKDDRDL